MKGGQSQASEMFPSAFCLLLLKPCPPNTAVKTGRKVQLQSAEKSNSAITHKYTFKLCGGKLKIVPLNVRNVLQLFFTISRFKTVWSYEEKFAVSHSDKQRDFCLSSSKPHDKTHRRPLFLSRTFPQNEPLAVPPKNRSQEGEKQEEEEEEEEEVEKKCGLAARASNLCDTSQPPAFLSLLLLCIPPSPSIPWLLPCAYSPLVGVL